MATANIEVGGRGIWNGREVEVIARRHVRRSYGSRRGWYELTLRFLDGSGSIFETEGRFRAMQPKPKAAPAPRRWGVRDVARWRIETRTEVMSQAREYVPGVGWERADGLVATVTIHSPDGQAEEMGGPTPLGNRQQWADCLDFQWVALFGRAVTPDACRILQQRVDEAIRLAINETVNT